MAKKTIKKNNRITTRLSDAELKKLSDLKTFFGSDTNADVLRYLINNEFDKHLHDDNGVVSLKLELF